MVVNQDEMRSTKLQQLGMTVSDESKSLVMGNLATCECHIKFCLSIELQIKFDTGHNLKTVGSVELQMLRVVPFTRLFS